MKKYDSLLEYAKANKDEKNNYLKEDEFHYDLHEYIGDLSGINLESSYKNVETYSGYIDDDEIRYNFYYETSHYDGFQGIYYNGYEKIKTKAEQVDLESFDAKDLNELINKCVDKLNGYEYESYSEWLMYASKTTFYYNSDISLGKEANDFIEDITDCMERYQIADIGYLDEYLDENPVENKDLIREQLMEANFGEVHINW